MLMRRMVAVVTFLMVVTALPATGQTAKKRVPVPLAPAVAQPVAGHSVALVVGNIAYPKMPLQNSVNDAIDLGKVLKNELGFDTEVVTDVGHRDLEKAIQRFVGKAGAGDVALFYYSGHGMQVGGENYLVPIDFQAQSEVDVKYEAYAANRVKELLEEKRVRLQVLILDACRDNPFRSTRSGASGLATMSGRGAFIAFAADQGKTAEDNPGERNGLFTKHLLRTLRQPGLRIDEVFNRVREGVQTESGGRQWPFSLSGVIGDFYFRPAVGSPAAIAEGSARANESNATELAFWDSVKSSRDAADYDDHLGRFPQGSFASLARRRRDELAKPAGAPVVAPAAGQGAALSSENDLLADLPEQIRSMIKHSLQRLAAETDTAKLKDGIAKMEAQAGQVPPDLKKGRDLLLVKAKERLVELEAAGKR